MPPRSAGRKPDFNLMYLNKETEEKGQIGVAWKNDNGSISIKLNTLVTINADKSTVLTLFKADMPRKEAEADVDFDDGQLPPF